VLLLSPFVISRWFLAVDRSLKKGVGEAADFKLGFVSFMKNLFIFDT
jgi:hypothetical protein